MSEEIKHWISVNLSLTSHVKNGITIPNELIIMHNKYISEYNESLKKGMSSIDLTLVIERVAAKIKHHTYFNEPIPNDIILEHNKLLNDYNEAIKKEKA